MVFENFFAYSSMIEEKGLDIGFELYGMGHLIWLVSILIVTVIIGNIYKNSSYLQKEKIKRFFAVAILLSEILKDIVLAIAGADMIGYLPMHLCSFAILGMMAHSYGHWQEVTGQLMAYAFFPGAIAALLFCNWTEYPFLNYMCIHSFAFHGWIVCYFVMLYRAAEIRPSYSGLWKTVAAMLLASIPVYFFNIAFDTNYLFLNEASEGSPLVIVWNLFGTRFGEIGYLIGAALLVIIVFHILYVAYKLLSKIFREKGKTR